MFSDEDQKKILKLYEIDKVSLEKLAKQFNCSYSAIRNIIISLGKLRTTKSNYYDKEITAFGEIKPLRQFVLNDKRCLVKNLRKVAKRIFDFDYDPETAMTFEGNLLNNKLRKSRCDLNQEEIMNRCDVFLKSNFTVITNFAEYHSILGIYGLLNTISGKLYVGSSVSNKDHLNNGEGGIGRSLSRHQRMLENKNHDNQHLQASINKYGEKAFAYILIEELNGKSPEEIKERESYWIEYYKTKDNKFGYNMADPIKGVEGLVFRPMTIEQIKGWIKQWIEDYGSPPNYISGNIPYDDRERKGEIRGGRITWKIVNQNLASGYSGLPGGITLKQLVYEVTGQEYKKKTIPNLPSGITYNKCENKYVVYVNFKKIGRKKVGRFDNQDDAIIALNKSKKLLEEGRTIEEIRCLIFNREPKIPKLLPKWIYFEENKYYTVRIKRDRFGRFSSQQEAETVLSFVLQLKAQFKTVNEIKEIVELKFPWRKK